MAFFAASVNAKKDHLYTSVTLVVGWALVMILVLPFVSRALNLPAGVAGAWIGTSEFADAAGFAAATTYGKMVGNEDAAIKSFTLMKVIGRDLWIGIWSVVFAAIATFVWEKGQTGRVPDAREIWWRFPKFVIGFFAASILMSAFTSGFAGADFNSAVPRRAHRRLESVLVLHDRRRRQCRPRLRALGDCLWRLLGRDPLILPSAVRRAARRAGSLPVRPRRSSAPSPASIF